MEALVAVKERRVKVSTYIFECQRGNGNLKIDYGAYNVGFVNNVIATSSRPADRLFATICRQGLPIARRNDEASERRRAAMTPEEREAERRMLREVFLIQQSQQAEFERNASRERAAQNLAGAIKESKKSTTNCIETSQSAIRCVTK